MSTPHKPTGEPVQPEIQTWAALAFGLPLIAAIVTAIYLWGKTALIAGGVVAALMCWNRAPLLTLLSVLVVAYMGARH